MSKQHRDFVVFVRNGVNINALVAYSRDVVTPATQTVPQSSEEHLTLVYLDPLAANAGVLATGEQLRNSIAIAFDVAPVSEGRVNGWRDTFLLKNPIRDEPGSGSEHSGASDWTAEGVDQFGFPVGKGSPEDVSGKFSALQRELGREKELRAQSEDLNAEYKAKAAHPLVDFEGGGPPVVQNDPAVVAEVTKANESPGQ